MTPEELNRHLLDQGAQARQHELTGRRAEAAAFSHLSPEQQQEAKMRAIAREEAKAAVGAIVIQGAGPVTVTGGNGNFTINFNSGGLSLTGDATVDCSTDPPTVTFRLSIK